MKQILPALAALALAGCAATTQLADPREIAVEADVAPAGAMLSSSMKGLVSQTGPSYVTVIVHEARPPGGKAMDSLPNALTSGSGFVVDSAGHVITAAHVALRQGADVEARGADGRIYNGRVIIVRPENDMALIKLSGFKGTPVTPASNTCMRKGEPIFSLGKPHAQGDIARIGEVESMTFGRAVNYNGYGYPDAMVLKMSTKKGESGGPVFNSSGELTGMVVSTLSDGNGRPLNLAHAIPTAALAGFVCANTSCSPRWQALRAQVPSRCGGA
jgi:S1-C subfamily serine protease